MMKAEAANQHGDALENARAGRRSTGRRAAALVLRLLVGGLFIYTGVSKLSDLEAFASEILQYDMVGEAVARPMAILLPWVELVGGALYVVGFWRRENAALLGVMLLGFTVAKAVALGQGIELVGCGCVRADSPLAVLFHDWNGVWLNLALIALIVSELFVNPARRRFIADRSGESQGGDSDGGAASA